MAWRQMYLLFAFLVVLSLVSSLWIFSHLYSTSQSVRKLYIAWKVDSDVHKTLRLRSQLEMVNFDIDGAFNKLPAIVRAWRNAKVDWRQLPSKDSSKLERFRSMGEDDSMLIDFLTRYHESGLSQRYGKHHGPLLEYSVCNSVKDLCMAHDAYFCGQNEFCTWDQDTKICRIRSAVPPTAGSAQNVAAFGGKSESLSSRQRHSNLLSKGRRKVVQESGYSENVTKQFVFRPCDRPSLIENGSISYVSDFSRCSNYVTEKVLILTLGKESQSSFYSWWLFFQELYDWWKKALDSSRNVHFVLADSLDTSMLGFLGTLSQYCWRRLQQMPIGICFCDVSWKEVRPMYSDSMYRAARYVSQFMTGQSVEQQRLARNHSVLPEAATQKLIIGLISQRHTRFILNEFELCNVASDEGYVCKLLPIMAMTIYEQMWELSSIDIVVGLHGSELNYAIFLRPLDSVMVQLLPCLPTIRNSYRNISYDAKVQYLEWKHHDPSLAVAHWDMLDEVSPSKKEEILKFGMDASATVPANKEGKFWINRDVIVPTEDWKSIIANAAKKLRLLRARGEQMIKEDKSRFGQ